mmetsp:Transcript_1828/g.2693  ORF Transcript_1828/g.2693 Transcript_1828/m.2693 type:complete len:80 (-) Transcript_1828:797-1036(-)
MARYYLQTLTKRHGKSLYPDAKSCDFKNKLVLESFLLKLQRRNPQASVLELTRVLMARFKYFSCKLIHVIICFNFADDR